MASLNYVEIDVSAASVMNSFSEKQFENENEEDDDDNNNEMQVS